MYSTNQCTACQEVPGPHRKKMFTCEEYFDSIDWENVSSFWKFCINSELPPIITGEGKFTTNAINSILVPPSKTKRLTKKRFILQIRYFGGDFYGYQRQGKEDLVKTVEGVISQSLGGTVVAAGRTDRV